MSPVMTGVALGVMSGVWYAGNIYFNILNKQVLKVFMYPFTCTCIYMATLGLIAVAGWALGLLQPPKVHLQTTFFSIQFLKHAKPS